MGDFSRLLILDATSGQTELRIHTCWWDRTARFMGPSVAVFARRYGRRHSDRQCNRALRIVDRAPATPRREYARRLPGVRSLVAVGDRIVTGHGDGFVRVWDAATGRLIWRKLLAPVIGRGVWNARAALVALP